MFVILVYNSPTLGASESPSTTEAFCAACQGPRSEEHAPFQQPLKGKCGFIVQGLREQEPCPISQE